MAQINLVPHSGSKPRVHSHDMITNTPKPSEVRKVLFEEVKMRPLGSPTGGPDVPPRPATMKPHDEMVYTDPIKRHLYNKPKEIEDTRNNNLQKEQKQENGHYEPIENRETVV